MVVKTASEVSSRWRQQRALHVLSWPGRRCDGSGVTQIGERLAVMIAEIKILFDAWIAAVAKAINLAIGRYAPAGRYCSASTRSTFSRPR